MPSLSLSLKWVARWLLPRRHLIPVPFPILPLFSCSPFSLHNSVYLTLSCACERTQTHIWKSEKEQSRKKRWKQVHAQYMRALSRVPFAPITSQILFLEQRTFCATQLPTLYMCTFFLLTCRSRNPWPSCNDIPLSLLILSMQ